VLLNVSRVAFEENIGLLLDAMLFIAGEGPTKNSYIQQAKDFNLEDNIAFVGYADSDSELIDC